MREARADRVVLLTTHYMDEADALADRIGIMARGRLRALGSAQHLKSRHGGGYRVDVKAADGAAEPVGAMSSLDCSLASSSRAALPRRAAARGERAVE